MSSPFYRVFLYLSVTHICDAKYDITIIVIRGKCLAFGYATYSQENPVHNLILCARSPKTGLCTEHILYEKKYFILRITMESLMKNLSTVVLFASVYTILHLSSSPSLPGGDSGELMAVSCQLGIAHPPGYPLYTVLSYFWINFPLPLPRLLLER